jgi:hypothetical protein
MSTFILHETKMYIQKLVISIKSRHLLLLFYKISIPFYAFLPALQNLKHVFAVEVRSSFSQPALHGFLDCPFSLVVVTFQVIFQGPEQVIVWGGQNPDCRMDARAVVRRFVFLCARKQTGNPVGTNFPISKNLYHLLDRTVPHSRLRCNFSDCYPSVLSEELVNFLLLALGCSSSRSTTARLMAMSVLPSLKCFTYLLTLLTPMQVSPYTPQNLS